MDTGHRTTLFGLLVLALPSSLPAPAYADGLPQPRLALVADYSDDPVLGIVGAGAVQYTEYESEDASATPRECTPRYMVGPGMGIPLSSGVIASGAIMITLGSAGFFETRGNRATMATGSIVVAAGVLMFVYSAVRLSKNKRERRRVCGMD